MAEGHATIRTYTVIFIWLVVLMFLTIAAWTIDLGPLNILIAMGIASVKAALVLMYFMHVKFSGRLVWVFSTGAFLWLGILLVLTMADYVTRTKVPRRLADSPAVQLFGTKPPATQPDAPPMD